MQQFLSFFSRNLSKLVENHEASYFKKRPSWSRALKFHRRILIPRYLLYFYYPDQKTQNKYINNIIYIVRTPTCFNASASSSGSLNLVLCWSYKIINITTQKFFRLKCSRDRCWMIKYSLLNVNNYNTWKLFVWWLYIKSRQSCGCNSCVGVFCMLGWRELNWEYT
jgi:hypothetical protein